MKETIYFTPLSGENGTIESVYPRLMCNGFRGPVARRVIHEMAEIGKTKPFFNMFAGWDTMNHLIQDFMLGLIQDFTCGNPDLRDVTDPGARWSLFQEYLCGKLPILDSCAPGVIFVEPEHGNNAFYEIAGSGFFGEPMKILLRKLVRSVAGPGGDPLANVMADLETYHPAFPDLVCHILNEWAGHVKGAKQIGERPEDFGEFVCNYVDEYSRRYLVGYAEICDRLQGVRITPDEIIGY